MPRSTTLALKPTPIVPDGGVVKVHLSSGDPCKLAPRWVRGSKARLHFTAHTIPYEGKKHTGDWFKGGLALARLGRDCAGAAESDSEASSESDDQDMQMPPEAPGSRCYDKQCGGKSHTHANHSHNDNQMESNATQPLATTSRDHAYAVDPNIRTKIGDSREWDGHPLELLIDRQFSVRVLELAVKTMRIGDRARFYCTPSYAEPYIQLEAAMRKERRRQQDLSDGIVRPPTSGCAHGCSPEQLDADRDLYTLFGCPVELEVELLDVLEPDAYEKSAWEMTPVERYHKAAEHRAHGADLFRAGDFERSATAFDMGRAMFEQLIHSTVVQELEWRRRRSMSEECHVIQDKTSTATYIADMNDFDAALLATSNIHQQIQTCQLNAAACRLKLGHNDIAIELCTAVLKREPDHIKALFRRSQAYTRSGRDLDLARADLERLCRLDPMNADVKSEMVLHAQKVQEDREKERKMFRGLFAV